METPEINTEARDLTIKVVQDDIEKRIHGKIMRLGLMPKKIDAVQNGLWLDVYLDGAKTFAVRMKINNLGERKFKFKDYGTTKKKS